MPQRVFFKFTFMWEFFFFFWVIEISGINYFAGHPIVSVTDSMLCLVTNEEREEKRNE